MFENHNRTTRLNVAVLGNYTNGLPTDLAGSSVGVERRGRAISSPAAQDGERGVRAVPPPAPKHHPRSTQALRWQEGSHQVSHPTAHIPSHACYGDAGSKRPVLLIQILFL